MTTTFEPLVWSDKFTTGVTEMDEQHMILVDLLNNTTRRIGENGGNGALTHIVLDLLSYAIYHFETEEHLMEQYGYAGAIPAEASLHLEQHRAFSAKVVATHEALKTGEKIRPDELIGFIQNWLVNHILKTDRMLAAFVLQQRARKT